MDGYTLTPSKTTQELTDSIAFSTRFATRMRYLHINVKEMTAVYMAIERWRTQFAGSHLTIYCYNEAVVGGLRKLSISGPAMISLRKIAMQKALDDIEFNVVWIPTKENFVADWLSRGQFRKLADYCPQLLLCRHRPRLGSMTLLNFSHDPQLDTSGMG